MTQMKLLHNSEVCVFTRVFHIQIYWADLNRIWFRFYSKKLSRKLYSLSFSRGEQLTKCKAR